MPKDVTFIDATVGLIAGYTSITPRVIEGDIHIQHIETRIRQLDGFPVEQRPGHTCGWSVEITSPEMKRTGFQPGVPPQNQIKVAILLEFTPASIGHLYRATRMVRRSML